MPTNQLADVSALLDRYLLSLDADELDDAWAHGLFTEDALVEFPMSRHEGIAGLAEYHAAALKCFAATQHLNSPAVVEISGDRARLRANLIATHVPVGGAHGPAGEQSPLFMTGTSVSGEACRTPAGWRLHQLSFQLIWKNGTPPAASAG